YRIRREVRELILFAAHNVIKDPPFSHLDLISCRNVLIYLNRTAQSRILEVMHFALNSGGYLFLGASESIDSGTDLFSTVDKEHHIFQSRPVPSRRGYESARPDKVRSVARVLAQAGLASEGCSLARRRRLACTVLHGLTNEQFRNLR